MPGKCAICETRRPRRWCPGIDGDICPQCCGTGREVTIDCPFECQYLRDARQHEKLIPVDPETFPHPDIRISESFLKDHERLLVLLGRTVLRAALETPGAADMEVREALDGLAKTYRTLQSGLVYESVPSSPPAAAIYARVQKAVAEFRQQITQSAGAASVFRDSELLGILVFLVRLSIDRNNGRPRGKVFLDFLKRQFPQDQMPQARSPLIVS